MKPDIDLVSMLLISIDG